MSDVMSSGKKTLICFNNYELSFQKSLRNNVRRLM